MPISLPNLKAFPFPNKIKDLLAEIYLKLILTFYKNFIDKS